MLVVFNWGLVFAAFFQAAETVRIGCMHVNGRRRGQ